MLTLVFALDFPWNLNARTAEMTVAPLTFGILKVSNATLKPNMINLLSEEAKPVNKPIMAIALMEMAIIAVTVTKETMAITVITDLVLLEIYSHLARELQLKLISGTNLPLFRSLSLRQ